MSARSQDDPTSFFQVGGIHGLPFAPWDGDDNDNDDQVGNNQWGGYCTHGSVLFPTWHRPYVLLYEVSKFFNYFYYIHSHNFHSKFSIWRLARLLKSTPPIRIAGSRQPQAFVNHTGIGPETPYLPPKSFHYSRLPLLRRMEERPSTIL